MADILQIGLSALLAQQRALGVTSNNIANASTPGYSRQRAELATTPTERVGQGFVGTGVTVADIRRFADDLLATQVNSAASGLGRSAAFASLADGVDALLADSDVGLNATLERLVGAVQDLANDPASGAAREALLSQGRQVASTFEHFGSQITEIDRQVGAQINASVTEIDSLAQGIADVNKQILTSSANGAAPPNLLDERDRLVARLAELVSVRSLPQQDGTVSVFIGSGQSLVLGGAASKLAVVPGQFAGSQPDIALSTSGGNTIITGSISGGSLGGVLDFRREMLNPLRNDLGRIAAGLASTFNEIHREGIDLNGQLGGDFFSIAAPQVSAGVSNAGTGALAVTVEDVSALEATGYRLRYDGSSYALSRTDNGAEVAVSGTGTALDPLRAEGLAIVVSGSPAAGDTYAVEALAGAAGSLRVAISDPTEVAAATPIRTRAGLSNAGDATISAGEVADINDPNLFTATTIEFVTPSTYSIDGAGSFAYIDGGDIVVNGARVKVSGTPAPGDTFAVEPNVGGVGDNRNALRLASVLGLGVLGGGNVSLSDASAQMLARVGTQTQEVTYQRDAQQTLLDHAKASLDSVSGVNLDEEAANMVAQQQLYQAAAKTIAVADSLFQTLLAALQR
jgi:flagellar hook-associated protein 1